ncbi:MAG: AarF/ABC1/UbiB kinase family protein [Anaerolineae bacterium]|nr:AarF/ABC1/UbiB kinase family protein [Anaerolineae bacterium]
MQNSSNPPSTSSSNGKIPAELEVVSTPNGNHRPPTPPSPPTPAKTVPTLPTVQEVISRRPRSLRMQYRFGRTVIYFAWLFVQTLFWYMLVQRYSPDYVKRTNLERWRGWARSFRGFAIDMGGVMIKAGQFISTRSDILPPEVTDELAVLRDEVPYVPSYKIREIIEAELGPLPTRFSQFDDVPVAAASLGQVHRGRLHNGDRVVVKVQRPGIAEICHTDLAAMNVVAHVAMRFKFISRRMDAVALIQEFGRVLLEELSYKHEAQNAKNFARMFKENLGVYIPAVYQEHSSDCVITIEDVTTIKLDDYAALEAAGINRKAVANRLMQTYLLQIFEERHFHADPHPGNLFVYPLPADSDAARGQDAGSGKPFYLIFIDFGMTGTLTQQIVNGLVGTMAAVITRDSKKLIQSYSELGFLLPGADVDRLEEATRAVFDQVWGLTMEQMRDVSFDDMADLGKEFSDLLFSMPFQVPQDFIYLGRTVSILSGLCTSLDPSFNPWNEMQPYMQKMIMARGSTSDVPAFGSPILQSLFGGNGGSALLGIGQTLIGRALAPQNSGVLDRLERGDIKLRVEAGSGLQRQLVRIEGQGKRTSRAVIFGSFMISSTIFYVNGDIGLAVVGYVVSGITFVIMTFTGEQ